MKRILGKCLPDKMIPALTSHSLKATLLTYLSKFGCFHTYSELLGYHLTQHQSALNYQRDALAAPIRTMVDMLGAVQNGAFCPAAGRDDMFPSDDCWVTVADQLCKFLGKSLIDIAEVFHDMPLSKMSSHEDVGLSALWNPMEHVLL